MQGCEKLGLCGEELMIHGFLDWETEIVFYTLTTTFGTPEEKTFDYGILWEREKMLQTSIFSFSHNVFYPMKDKFYDLSEIEPFVCKITLNLDKAKIFCCLVKGSHIIWEQ